MRRKRSTYKVYLGNSLIPYRKPRTLKKALAIVKAANCEATIWKEIERYSEGCKSHKSFPFIKWSK